MLKSPWRVAAMAVVLLLLAVAAAALLKTVDVVDKGNDLRPYESGKVFKIRIADTITFYADEESRTRPDLVTGSALLILSTITLMAGWLLRAAGGARRPALFYTLAGVGFGYLGIDELVAVHETVGHNLPFLADLPGVTHPDDVIFAMYMIPAAAFVWYFRDVLQDSTLAWRLFLIGGAAALGAGVADVTPTGRLDELLEFVTAGCVTLSFLILVSTHLAKPRFGGPDDEGSPDAPEPALAGSGA